MHSAHCRYTSKHRGGLGSVSQLNMNLFHNKYEFGSQQIWYKHWTNKKAICSLPLSLEREMPKTYHFLLQVDEKTLWMIRRMGSACVREEVIAGSRVLHQMWEHFLGSRIFHTFVFSTSPPLSSSAPLQSSMICFVIIVIIVLIYFIVVIILLYFIVVIVLIYFIGHICTHASSINCLTSGFRSVHSSRAQKQ